MLSPCPILFAGHNERAVIALCRFFDQQRLAFALVASGPDDAIFQTAWRDKVILVRNGPALTVSLMHQLARTLEHQGQYPVLCPTSEFLNQFALSQGQAMREAGWDCNLPHAEIYLRLTNKSTSPACLEALAGLRAPAEQAAGHWSAPCVIKPRHNLVNGKVAYPILCRDAVALAQACQTLEPGHWFAQDWVEGQSIYLCAYLDRAGGHDSYWQSNLLQQPNGKSIVLACTGQNPGIDVDRLMSGLHRLGYWGPFMMEVIQNAQGQLHFIEVNPRFWGPLNLALQACPELLHRFALDCGLKPVGVQPLSAGGGPHWYAWSHGAKAGNCRVYPALAAALGPQALEPWLLQHDVYGQPDTLQLFNQH